MPSQTLFSTSSEQPLKPERWVWWLDTCLALAIAGAIAFAANGLAQPIVVNQTASWLAQRAPSAAAQGVADYLAAHGGAGPAAATAGVPAAVLPSAAQCLTAQVVAPPSGSASESQP